MRKLSHFLVGAGIVVFTVFSFAQTFNATATVTALRLSNTITGGLMPSTDPLFTTMVSQVAAGNVQAAAETAATSSYAANYLYRRLALQMQNPNFDPSTVTDNDSTAFLIAHFAGVSSANPPIKPSISTILSDNNTYTVTLPGGTAQHVASLLPAAGKTPTTNFNTIAWSTDLAPTGSQQAFSPSNNVQKNAATTTKIQILQQDTGGFATLSDRARDNSFAQYGATAGTNLRMIEGIWEIATGVTLTDVESTTSASIEVAPPFVPTNNPNFFVGQGQVACIACHGGGMSTVTHGYSTVADKFDFDPVGGFVYYTTPTTATMKSLGSNNSPTARAAVLACNSTTNPVACNPDTVGASTTQAWDLSSWQADGVLKTMGWRGPITGSGLNSLGQAIGQAAIVYQFLTQRVVAEICPMGTFSPAQVQSIAAAADPGATPAGTDAISTIVALVASSATCLDQ